MAAITQKLITRQRQQLLMNPKIAPGTRRASQPDLFTGVEPLISPSSEANPKKQSQQAQLKSKSPLARVLHLGHRRNNSEYSVKKRNIKPDSFIKLKDPLECLIPRYEDYDRLNLSMAKGRTLYLDRIFVGFLLGVVLALSFKIIIHILIEIYT